MTAESGAQAAQGGLAQGTHRAATILHISDLHFGWGFSEDLWQGLCDLAAGEIKPDLVIATGDFVHSPFRWRLATARKGLQGLQDQIRHANAACQIIAVAGNHDTRIQGLLPVRWILPVLLALVLLAGLIGWWVANFQWLVWVLVGAIVLWGVSYACLGNITTALSEFMLSDPKPYPELGLMVFPFDSASLSIRAACGKVPREQFLKAQTSQSQEFLYRIAILHHHPLPIPYDDAQEDMLILHNAGAFLQEMSKRQVRLILHGHKHHHCFSRVTINAGTEKAFEVGVLAAGTPSAGKRPGRSGYHFNVLRLDPEGNLAVTPYTALDGAFEAGEAFFVEGRELGTKRMYEQNRAVTGR
ncbi:MAG: metallophosphoesterase family protein, partial [Candidatus Binatia bacterium]